MDELRIGIIGLGKNTKLRHVPGFRACGNVTIAGVCNSSSESTSRAAAEFEIPKTYGTWQALAADPEIDAVLVGTWPYLHCAATLAALEQGKHVLTEARMACNLAEARSMYAAAQQHPDLVTQIVPSPFGLRAGRYVQQLLAEGYVGQVREVFVAGTSHEFADPQQPLHWRQSSRLSGINMLTLGILHETMARWLPDPVHVTANAQTFVPSRMSGDGPQQVQRPDLVHILSQLPEGGQCIYQLNAVTYHGPGFQIHIYGSEGTLKYELAPADRLFGARRDEAELRELEVPGQLRQSWNVEADFVSAIRGGSRPELTDFASGLRYMRFTEAVETSLSDARRVHLSELDED